jgi:hypothetical protein
MPNPPLRLSSLIAKATDGPVTLNRLAELVNEANRKAGTNCSVDRRTLRKIRDEPQNVGLTYNTLVALNTYYKDKDRGLSLQHLPILETRGVLEVLVDSPRLVFMLGAKPRPEERRTDLSWWDVRSLAGLLTQASKLDIHHKFEMEDVLWRCPVDPSALKSERWYRFLEDDQVSVVSIGSPLAALSSEVMLARMFGVQPFVTPRFKTGRQVPFFFVWLRKLARNFPSAFGLTWRELQTDYGGLARRVKTNHATAFILDGRPHAVPAQGNAWTMYGIIAAQRRPAGNVWLVVSGLAGPATHAAATLVNQITAELPGVKGQPSSVLWVPVMVKIKTGEASPLSGDIREVVHAEFDGEPRIWPEEPSPSQNTSRPA